MKKLLLVIYVSLFVQTINAQTYFDSTGCFGNSYIDTLYTFCDTNYNPNFVINIEPTPNNIWQKGKTYKFGTSNARDTSCAIFTDSINPYPINNYSAFNFRLPKRLWLQNYYLKFWHKFDTDSLRDGCWLEVSSDSGLTWKKLNSNLGLWDFQACGFYNNDLLFSTQDTLLNAKKGWSGNSQGWQHTALWLNMQIPVRSNMTNAIRFVFKSDSMQTNKTGWIIDDIAIGWVDQGGSINETSYINRLPIFPNPSHTGKFTISFPSHYVKGTMKIYNQVGQLMLSQALSSELDLSQFSNGMYYYRTAFDDKTYSGYLQKH